MASFVSAQTIYNIKSYGADTLNGFATNTTAIQAAIDACSAGGGGIVLVDAGTFKTSTLVLKNNVTLKVATGATLKAPPLNNDYPEYPYDRPSWSSNYTTRSLIFAQGVHNIRITGGGTIDCNGKQQSYLGVSKNFRPFGFRIHRCTNVVVDNIYLETAPQWMLHIADCDTVHIFKIDIYNQGLGSNDGIDIDGSRKVIVEDCNIDSNDDPLVVKTHSLAAAEDVLVRRCTFATYERGVKIGNESCGPMRRIRFEDIILKKSVTGFNLAAANAIYIAVADGGLIDSVSFERIDVQTPYETPIFIRLCNRGNKYDNSIPPPPVQYLRNVLIKDLKVVASKSFPCSITAIPGYYVENVRLENIAISALGDTTVSYTSNIPELVNKRPEPDIWADSLPSYGFYVRHTKNIVFENVCISLQHPDKRPEYFMQDTAATIVNSCTYPYTSLEEIPVENIKLYPNPVAAVLSISTNEMYFETEVIDLTGKICLANRNAKSLEVSLLPKGIYVLKFISNEKIFSSRFIKE